VSSHLLHRSDCQGQDLLQEPGLTSSGDVSYFGKVRKKVTLLGYRRVLAFFYTGQVADQLSFKKKCLIGLTGLHSLILTCYAEGSGLSWWPQAWANPANDSFREGSMRMALISRKPGIKDVGRSDLEHEHAKLIMQLYQESYSERHPVKHWALARIDPPTMKAIGEDPQEFATFRDEFRNAIKPNDDFEDFLACKMVEARWRQLRLLRAEAAILAQGRCQFVLEQRRQLADPQGGVSGVDCAAPSLTGPVPTTGPSGPGPQAERTGIRSRFATLVKFLKTVQAAVASDGFQGESLKLLESVSESEVPATTAVVPVNSQSVPVERAKNRSAEERPNKNFLTWLGAEITAFEELEKLDRAAEAELSGYAFDARLLLPDKELEKIRRYQADTERQFDSAFKRLMEWRKVQAAAAQRLEVQRRKV
jgi:hypothetical protein